MICKNAKEIAVLFPRASIFLFC